MEGGWRGWGGGWGTGLTVARSFASLVKTSRLLVFGARYQISAMVGRVTTVHSCQ